MTQIALCALVATMMLASSAVAVAQHRPPFDPDAYCLSEDATCREPWIELTPPDPLQPSCISEDDDGNCSASYTPQRAWICYDHNYERDWYGPDGIIVMLQRVTPEGEDLCGMAGLGEGHSPFGEVLPGWTRPRDHASLVSAGAGNLPAPCAASSFPPPEAYHCPTPYVELVPDGSDELFGQVWHCRETGHSLGRPHGETVGCGSAHGWWEMHGWTLPPVAAEAPDPTTACEVEVWRWYHSAGMESFGVEGVTSCREARIAMIVFDMDGETPTFVGVGDGFIEHRAFTVLLRDVPHPPANPVIEFTITPFEDFEE